MSTLDIYDSEIAEIERVSNILKVRARQPRNYDDFQREIKERFAEIGFVVDVKWWETNVEGVMMPEIEIIGRVDKSHVFDRDRMVHEVTNDLLDLGEGGVIKTNPHSIITPDHKH